MSNVVPIDAALRHKLDALLRSASPMAIAKMIKDFERRKPTVSAYLEGRK